MPQIQRHDEVEQWILNESKKYLTRKPRTGVHVSDLLTPRKAYWAQAEPKAPTDRETLYFLAGRGHEEAIVALTGLGRYHKERGEWGGTEDEPYKKGDGIKYEVDVLAPAGINQWIPVELKTNRRPKVPTPEEVLEEYSYAVEQLGNYTAILDRGNIGYLIELHLMARNLALTDTGEETDPYAWLRQSRPEIVCYQIDWTAEELDEIRHVMQEKKRLLLLAYDLKDHTILPECPNWMCGRVHVKESDPKCPSCGRTYENRRMRKCEDCTAQGKRVDLVRDSEEVFVPSCRWWASCRPSQWQQYLDNYWKPGQGEP